MHCGSNVRMRAGEWGPRRSTHLVLVFGADVHAQLAPHGAARQRSARGPCREAAGRGEGGMAAELGQLGAG